MASLLIQHMTHIARQKGLTSLQAEVLSGNKAMLIVFKRSGLPMKTRREGNTY
jgi:hypothetical protein